MLEYTIHNKTYRSPTTSQVVYYGKIVGPKGYWKTSQEFGTYQEAEQWCISKCRYGMNGMFQYENP